MPSEYRSEARVAGSPAATSGAMYSGVPTYRVADPSGVSVASPKSDSTRRPSPRRSTFSGLTSRWMMPASWMAPRPLVIASASCSRWSSVRSAALPLRRSSRSDPSASSITRKRSSPLVCRSNTRQTCAWFSARATRSSRVNSCISAGCAARSERSSFTATGTPASSSRARSTYPVAPWPISPSIR